MLVSGGITRQSRRCWKAHREVEARTPRQIPLTSCTRDEIGQNCRLRLIAWSDNCDTMNGFRETFGRSTSIRKSWKV